MRLRPATYSESLEQFATRLYSTLPGHGGRLGKKTPLLEGHLPGSLKARTAFSNLTPDFQRAVNHLSVGCMQREVPFPTVHDTLKKLYNYGKITSREDLLRTFRNLASDLNMVHVLKSAPGYVLKRFGNNAALFEENGKNLLGLQTLMHYLGLRDEEVQASVANHAAWMKHAREARRLLASPVFILRNDVIRQLLQRSFDRTYGEYYSSLPGNQRVKVWLRRRHLRAGTWLQLPFERRYDEQLAEVRAMDAESKTAVFQRLYLSLHRLSQLGLSRNRLGSLFARFRQLAPLEGETPADFLDAGFEHFVVKGKGIRSGSRFKLDDAKMSGLLSSLIVEIHRFEHKAEQKKEPVLQELVDIKDEMVALQRMLAEYDPRIGLTTLQRPVNLPGQGRAYLIKKSDKDPIHYLTGGNDTGVCDATTEPKALTLKDTARNSAYQVHEIFRVDGRGNEKRIGQIRLYLGSDEKGKPVILCNSIDLEAEERQNLLLYRRAVDYVREYASRVGVRRLLLGRHADMHLHPFENTRHFQDMEKISEKICCCILSKRTRVSCLFRTFSAATG